MSGSKIGETGTDVALRKLRQDAESLLHQRPEYQSPDALIYELEVHQIELEMQNHELRQAQGELLDARDRYLDLYEFAPSGYLTLDDTGLVDELNLKFAGMLEIERRQLVGRRFALFVVDEDKELWHRLFLEIRDGAGEPQRSATCA